VAIGTVTPALSPALTDLVVRAGRIYENVLALIVVSLMVFKPF
jgi:hypothetical protein